MSEEQTFLTEDDIEQFFFWLPKLEAFDADVGYSPVTLDEVQWLFRLMYNCALRAKEVLNIRRQDFDLENKLLTVGTTKIARFPFATILLNDVPALKEFLEGRPPDETLFKMTRSTVWKYANDIGKLAGIEIFNKLGNESKIFTNLFRKSRAMQMKKNGADDDLISLKLRLRFGNPSLNIKRPTLDDLKSWESEKLSKINLSSPPTFEDANLRFPSEDEIKYGVSEIQEKLFVDSDKIIEIIANLISGRHVLLAGAIGTGKTQLSRLISQTFWRNSGGYYSEIYTATSEWGINEVIGGILPKMSEDIVTYTVQLGCVSDTVLRNWKNKLCKERTTITKNGKTYRGCWLTIDEFNRADIDKAFGELFTSLETRSIKAPSTIKDEMFQEIIVPKDYRIIGTLNTADKHHLFKLSDALKRRFAYVEIESPKRKDKELEIYYALKNSSDELTEDLSKLFSLNLQKKIIDLSKTDKTFYKCLTDAYDILSLIRLSKPLGTGILKLIYQTLIASIKLTKDYDKSLDYALTANLIPQLEDISKPHLETIRHIFFADPIIYFKRIHDENSFNENDVESFNNFLEFIGVSSTSTHLESFKNSTLNDVGLWNSFDNKYRQLVSSRHLPMFDNALQNLVKSSAYL